MGQLCSGRSEHSTHAEVPKGTTSTPNKKSAAPQVTYSEKPGQDGKSQKILRQDTEDEPIAVGYNGQLQVTGVDSAKQIKVAEHLKTAQPAAADQEKLKQEQEAKRQ